MSTPDSGFFLAPLPGLAVLRFQGPDAIQFLHSQLSHDIAAITSQRALLNAYCTARGRLLATLVVWPAADAPDTLYALVSADIAENLQKKLTMFVFRSKVKISIVDLSVMGLSLHSSTPLETALQASGLNADSLASGNTWQLYQTADTTFIQAPSSPNHKRWWIILDKPAQQAKADSNTMHWESQDIAAGLPWVTARTQELFTAQALNLDLIDAISFTKGCYPGQEVIARSHYRGAVKRRMVFGTSPAAPKAGPTELPGADIFNNDKPGNPAGRVINASQFEQQLYLLLEITLADQETAEFRLCTPDGPPITLQVLPYPLNTQKQSA